VAVVDLSQAPDAATLEAVRRIDATVGSFVAMGRV
jgi:hypothetical protein